MCVAGMMSLTMGWVRLRLETMVGVVPQRSLCMVCVILERGSLMAVALSWCVVWPTSVSSSLLEANFWAIVKRGNGGARLQWSSRISRIAI